MKKVLLIVLPMVYLCALFAQRTGYEFNDHDMLTEDFEPKKKEERVDPERIAQLQQSAGQLSDVISEIQQKVASSRQLEGLLSGWEDTFDHIKQISYVLQDEIYATIASGDKFRGFYSALNGLRDRLGGFNKQLVVSEFALTTRDIRSLFGLTPGSDVSQVSDSYQKIQQQTVDRIEKLKFAQNQKSAQAKIKKLRSDSSVLTQAYKAFILQEKAQGIVHAVIDELSKLKDKHIFADFSNIEKIYKKEAARIKKEQEEKEAKARLEQQQEEVSDYWDEYWWDYDTDYE